MRIQSIYTKLKQSFSWIYYSRTYHVINSKTQRKAQAYLYKKTTQRLIVDKIISIVDMSVIVKYVSMTIKSSLNKCLITHPLHVNWSTNYLKMKAKLWLTGNRSNVTYCKNIKILSKTHRSNNILTLGITILVIVYCTRTLLK